MLQIRPSKFGGSFNARLFSCFPEVVQNAELIETHRDRYEGAQREDSNLRQMFVLASAFMDDYGINPVKLEIKDFKDGRKDSLHVAIVMPPIEKAPMVWTEPGNESLDHIPERAFSNYKLSDILSAVKNDPNADSLGKYIPPQFSSNFAGQTGSVDSTGRNLTPAQQEYFKDSKIRDDNGELTNTTLQIWRVVQRKEAGDVDVYGET